FAPKELLAGLFTSLGAAPQAAQDYADRIIAWRSPANSDNTALDSEAALYRAAGRPYGPRRGPFLHVAELWLVLGPPPQLIERALPYLTIFNGQAGIDLEDAAPAVLAALPGMTPAILSNVLNARAAGANGQALLEALGSARPAAAVTTGSAAFRVTALVRS